MPKRDFMFNRARLGWLLVALLLGLLWLVFSHWTATTWLAWPRFLAAVLLLVMLPGWLLVRALRLRARPLEALPLSLALGMLAAGGLHAAQTWAGLVWPLRLWVLAGGLHALWRGRVAWSALRSAAARSSPWLVLLPIVLLAVWTPLLCLNYYYGNLALQPGGGLSFVRVPDLLLHAALTAELTHTFPPQVPFVAGEPLNYHLGMDLVGAVLQAHGGVAPMDWMARFGPTWFLAFDVLAIFALARRFTGSVGLGAAAAGMVILGEDLAFVWGLLERSPNLWCADYFGAPTIYALYYFNPLAPALGLLCVTLLGIQRRLAGASRGWAAATAMCGAALLEVKIFVFIHLLLAAGVVLVGAWIVLRRRVLLGTLGAMVLAAAPLAYSTARQNGQAGAYAWHWASGWDGYIAPAFRTHGGWLLACAPLAVAGYVALTFGLRLAGLPVLLTAFRRRRSRLFAVLLAVFVLLGPLLSLTTRIARPGAAPDYNNAIWFLVASKYVAWLFALAALGWCWRRCGRLLRIGLALVAGGLSLPGTIQFVVQAPRLAPATRLAPAAVAALQFLNRTAPPGATALTTLDDALLATTALRLPVGTSYAASFVSADKLAARTRDRELFLAAWRQGELRAEILARYRVAWLLLPRGFTATPPRTAPAPAFSNADYLVYRFAPAGP